MNVMEDCRPETASVGQRRWQWAFVPASLSELVLAALLVTSLALAIDQQPLKAGAALAGAIGLGLYLRTRIDASAIAAVCGLSLFTTIGVLAMVLDLRGTVRWVAFGALLLAGILFLVARYWETEQLNRAGRFGALLLFEGRIGSSEYQDQRVEFCRALLALAQRHDRPVSVLALQWRSRWPDTGARDGRMSRILESMDRHMLRFEIAELIKRSVRQSDIVTVDRASNELFIMCPDTPSAGALMLARRLEERIRTELQTQVGYSVAEYPVDGYVLEEIVSTALQRGRTGMSYGDAQGSGIVIEPRPEPPLGRANGRSGHGAELSAKLGKDRAERERSQSLVR